MRTRDEIDEGLAGGDQTESDPWLSLVAGVPTTAGRGPAVGGIVVGGLIGIWDEGTTPLVAYPGQPGSGGIAAGPILDLHGAHVGRHLVLAFEGTDPGRPIVIGVIRGP